jgi:hypothetical protein
MKLSTMQGRFVKTVSLIELFPLLASLTNGVYRLASRGRIVVTYNVVDSLIENVAF